MIEIQRLNPHCLIKLKIKDNARFPKHHEMMVLLQLCLKPYTDIDQTLWQTLAHLYGIDQFINTTWKESDTLALYTVKDTEETDGTNMGQYSMMFQHNTRLCLSR
jgi:hypothetical protein